MILNGFRIDYKSVVSFSDQLVDFIIEQIRLGNIKPGEKMPTMREAALRTNLGIVTVNNAYQKLIQNSILESHGRHGVYVAENSHDIEESAQEAIELSQVEMEFVELLRPAIEFGKQKGIDTERLIEIVKMIEKSNNLESAGFGNI